MTAFVATGVARAVATRRKKFGKINKEVNFLLTAISLVGSVAAIVESVANESHVDAAIVVGTLILAGTASSQSRLRGRCRRHLGRRRFRCRSDIRPA